MTGRAPFPGERPKNWVAPDTGGTKRGCGFYALCGLGVLVGLGVIGSLLPETSAPGGNGGEAQVAAGPALQVTPEELRAAYDKNEVAAKAAFAGRVLTMTGELDKIDLDLTDDPVLRFKTAKPYDHVSANFTKADSAAVGLLEKGQQLTVTCGKITEMMGTPILSECRIGS